MYNLQPGCPVWDIHGNRPIDEFISEAYYTLERQWREEGMPECEKCESNHSLQCKHSELFYEGRCWVLDEQAETLAREMMEHHR